MKAILGILFFVIFGLIGMRAAGSISTALIGTRTFQSPDEVAQFTLVANISISVLFALVGALLGVMLAYRLKSKVIRTES